MLRKEYIAVALGCAFALGSVALANETTTIYSNGRRATTTVTTTPSMPLVRTQVIRTAPFMVPAPVVIESAPVTESVTKTTVTKTESAPIMEPSVTETRTSRTESIETLP